MLLELALLKYFGRTSKSLGAGSMMALAVSGPHWACASWYESCRQILPSGDLRNKHTMRIAQASLDQCHWWHTSYQEAHNAVDDYRTASCWRDFLGPGCEMLCMTTAQESTQQS